MQTYDTGETKGTYVPLWVGLYRNIWWLNQADTVESVLVLLLFN